MHTCSSTDNARSAEAKDVSSHRSQHTGMLKCQSWTRPRRNRGKSMRHWRTNSIWLCKTLLPYTRSMIMTLSPMWMTVTMRTRVSRLDAVSLTHSIKSKTRSERAVVLVKSSLRWLKHRGCRIPTANFSILWARCSQMHKPKTQSYHICLLGYCWDRIASSHWLTDWWVELGRHAIQSMWKWRYLDKNSVWNSTQMSLSSSLLKIWRSRAILRRRSWRLRLSMILR